MKKEADKFDFAEPEATVACFFNSVFGHTRNWPRAYSCLAPSARERFGPERGLQSFADYWDDKLSFLEELVKSRHKEFPYKHRTCFTPDRIEREELSGGRAIVSVALVENHVARERLMIAQTKELRRHGRQWLLSSGELEGDLDDIISVKDPRARRVE